jgi:dihydrofolate reductase
VADQPGHSEDNKDISRRYRDIEIVIVSDSLVIDPALPLASNSLVVGRADAAVHVATLKEHDGGDILIFGSHTMWTGLLRAGVVDELHLMVGAAVVGDGRRIFPADLPVTLRLLGVSSSAESSNVVVRYAVG